MQTVTTRKTKLEIPVPDGWHEVPFYKAFQLIARNDLTELEILSIISGVDREILRKETDIETITHFTNSILFLNSLPDDKGLPFPNSVQHPEKDERVSLPRVTNGKFDMGGMTVGQVEDMREVIKQQNIGENSDPIQVFEVYPKVCSIYLQPYLNPVGGGYDYETAMTYAEAVEKIDFKTLYFIGNFFFMKLSGLVAGSPTGWQRITSSLRKSKRGLNAWARRLASMLP